MSGHGDHTQHHDHVDHSQMNHADHNMQEHAGGHNNMQHDHDQTGNVLANLTNLINTTIVPLLTQQVDESPHLDQHNHHTDNINHMDQNNPMGQSRHQEHSAHQNHGPMAHMMMSFHGGYNETILFSWWKIETLSGLIYSMLLIFVAASLYEGLKYFREFLFWKTYNSLQYRAVSMPEKNSIPETNERVVHMVGEVVHKQPPTMFSKMHIFQTFLHIVQVTLSFLLMLIFMTYNTWLCIAVASGAATGFFLFGWKKSVAVDVTEHCH